MGAGGPSNTHTVVYGRVRMVRGPVGPQHTHVVYGRVRRCGAGGPSNTHTVVMGE